tara:strand:+ start:3509 stop:3691 length:183 start_codon:yes stop_codon:yes gene_type:complete
MWAPRNHFATDIPYLKAMARLRVLVSQKALRIICESVLFKVLCTHKDIVKNQKREEKRDF